MEVGIGRQDDGGCEIEVRMKTNQETLLVIRVSESESINFWEWRKRRWSQEVFRG